MVYNENRCAFANIGASQYVPDLSELLSSLHSYTDNTVPQIIYIEGYFLTASRWKICQAIYDKCAQKNPNRIFAMNLSSKYVITENPNEIQWLVESSDLMFGNAGEFQQLANLIYKTESIDELIKMLAEKHVKRRKIAIITNGSLSVDVYSKNENDNCVEKLSFDVPKIRDDKLVDTTGAGDAFVAGFCYEYLRKSSLDECVKSGINVAACKISIVGGSLPLGFDKDYENSE